MKSFLLSTVFFVLSLSAFCTPAATIPRVRQIDTKLDGIPDEPFWKLAGKITDLTRHQLGTPDSEKTCAMMCMDQDNLYIGLICPESLEILPAPEETSAFGGDNVEIFLASLGESEWFRQIVIGPGGKSYSEYIEEDEFQYKTVVRKDDWCAELVIPLKQLPKFNGREFRFNLFRTRSKARRFMTWAPVEWGVDVTNFGTIRVEPLPEEIQHGPWTCALLSTSVLIRWQSVGQCFAELQYRAKGHPVFQKVSADCVNFIPNLRKLHTVELKDLTPGTEYEYCIGDSPLYHFTTLTQESADFSFAMTSDMHGHIRALETLLKRPGMKDAEFLILNGDMVSGVTGKTIFYDAFLDILTQQWKKNFLFLRGNHETRGWTTETWFDLFSGPERSANFSFLQKGVFFICLDTFADVQTHGDWKAAQIHFLKQIVLTREFQEAEYRLLFCHSAALNPGGHPVNIEILSALEPEQQKQIDGAFSGHAHRYLRVMPGQAKMFSSEPVWNGNEIVYAPPFPMLVNDAQGYMLFRKNTEKLQISAFRKDGKEVDSVTILRQKR